jgi:chromosome segregation ATPase
MPWQHYLTDDRDKLEARYVELSEESASRAEELGMLQAEEKRTRARAWRESEFTSVSGRDAEASVEASDVSAEYLKLRSELEALREERDLLRWRLDASDG